MSRRGRLPRVGAVLAAATLLLGVVGCGGDPDPAPSARPTTTPTTTPAVTPTVQPTATASGPTGPAGLAKRPNIVFVLMDDFSDDLLGSLGVVQELEARGASYPNSFVVDSLCCVSRSSTLTGQFPHQTGVRTNTSQVSDARGPLGGWPAFTTNGNPGRSFNVTLQQAGWTTGFVGKYLNEYEYNPGWKVPEVPAGWSQFNVLFGSAYDGWGFDSTTVTDGKVRAVHHATPSRTAPEAERDAAYAGQVIEDYALDFIAEHADGDAPYFLEVAPYAPHARTDRRGAWADEPFFPAAFRDRATPERAGNCGPVRCPSLRAADLPGAGDDPADNAPLKADGTPARAWNVNMPQAPVRAYSGMRQQRAQMVQSVDRTLRKILAAVDDNTYVVFTSDNGFHLGQLGLGEGKGTAYDTDVRVPLFVVGPGIEPGIREEMTTNIDLAPTFEEFAGLTPAGFRSGRSLVPSLLDASVRQRSHVYFEHTSEPGTKGDPDRVRNGFENDRIPSYLAVRGEEGLLIRNNLRIGAGTPQYGYEFYAYDEVDFEQRNQFADPAHAPAVAALMERLAAFDECTAQQGDDPVPASCRE